MVISKSIPALLLAWTAVLTAAQVHSAPHLRTAPATQDHAADDLKDAEDLLQKQQYQQAEEKLQALVGKQGDNPQAWFDLGFAQARLGQTTDSITSYKKA